MNINIEPFYCHIKKEHLFAYESNFEEHELVCVFAVRSVANRFIFEPNRESTLARFSSLVQPILSNIQALNGVSQFKVQIDTSTTTQEDIENNTIRGKIFIVPINSVEFISVDFEISNKI